MAVDDTQDTPDREIVSTRIFSAPRDLVWRAWSEPQHLMHWWGPKGFTNTFESFDFRPGGVWRFVMHGPNGADYKNEIVFVEIAKPERIVLDHVSAPQFRVTATFEDLSKENLAGKTRVTFRQVFESAKIYESVKRYAVPGNEENFDRLDGHLTLMESGCREVTITRSFAAPRALVWQAWTDPKHLSQWWGPRGFTSSVRELDVRIGGALSIVMHAPDGGDYPMRGVFRELIAPERLVFSNIAVDASDKPLLDGLTTVTFGEHAGKTEMVLHARAVALVPHAVAFLAGMEEGWTQSIDCLSEHLARETGAS